MKAKEIRELSKDELEKKRIDYKEEIFNLRFRRASSQLENPMRLKNLKKNIARINTILVEKN